MTFIHANFLHTTILKNTLVVFLISLFILSGCSSKNDAKITEVFKSNILDDDAKMFAFSLVFVYKTAAHGDNNKGNQQKQGKEKRKGKNNGGERPSQQDSNSSSKSNKRESQMTEELETRLVEKLKENGYCRKGFFELNRTLNKSIYTIHGECSESATPADRKNFINNAGR